MVMRKRGIVWGVVGNCVVDDVVFIKRWIETRTRTRVHVTIGCGGRRKKRDS